MPGIATPIANYRPGDLDFVVVRANTESEYSSVGGRMSEGAEREVLFQQSVLSRAATRALMLDYSGTGTAAPRLRRRSNARSPIRRRCGRPDSGGLVFTVKAGKVIAALLWSANRQRR